MSSCDPNMAHALVAIQSMLRTRLSLKYVLGLAGASFEPKEDGAWDIDLSLNALTADSFSFLAARRDTESVECRDLHCHICNI